MISESMKEIVKNNKEAIFDAEHFFDGYKDNPRSFAIECVKSAYEAGARWIVLCDTNGGTLPNEIYDIIQKYVSVIIPGDKLGIHAHNDTDNAIANSLAAIDAGVRQVQGTINGLGERCGNTNLISLIPTLVLKTEYQTNIDKDKLKSLTKLSKLVDDLLNIPSRKQSAYVGDYAFSHKGGLHAAAVEKNPRTYEHINPELVGNERNVIISNQAGKSNLLNQLKKMSIELSDDKLNDILRIIKKKNLMVFHMIQL